jgi:hypothetical protein
LQKDIEKLTEYKKNEDQNRDAYQKKILSLEVDLLRSEDAHKKELLELSAKLDNNVKLDSEDQLKQKMNILQSNHNDLKVCSSKMSNRFRICIQMKFES